MKRGDGVPGDFWVPFNRNSPLNVARKLVPDSEQMHGLACTDCVLAHAAPVVQGIYYRGSPDEYRDAMLVARLLRDRAAQSPAPF